jgi:hypothetical protein
MEKETEAAPIQNNSPLQRASGLSVSPSRTPPSVDTTPPTQVTGLIVGTVSNSQRKLGWKQIPASDFNRYNIFVLILMQIKTICIALYIIHSLHCSTA